KMREKALMDAGLDASGVVRRRSASGETQKRPFQLSFNGSLRVEFLVADQLAAAPGENRRTFDQARPLLLAPAGRESSDEAAVWRHAEEDRDAAVAGGIRRVQ